MDLEENLLFAGRSEKIKVFAKLSAMTSCLILPILSQALNTRKIFSMAVG